MEESPPLSFARVTLLGVPSDSRDIPWFTAPALRGALKNRLRKLTCCTRASDCAGCGLARHCPYGRMFETRNDGSVRQLRGAERVPPFVLKLPRVDGDQLLITCVLVGRAIDDLSVVLDALNEMGRGFTVGLEQHAPRTVQFRTIGVFALADDGCDYALQDGATWPESRRVAITWCDIAHAGAGAADVILEFLSPMHLVEKGSPVTRFDLDVFLRRLCTRVEVMSQCYCAGSVPDRWFDNVMEAARAVIVKQNDTGWVSTSRFSSRHRQNLTLAGFVGGVELRQVPGALIGLLRAGEALGVGKNTTSGCGEYEARILHRQALPVVGPGREERSKA